jgi:hypothetical protein
MLDEPIMTGYRFLRGDGASYVVYELVQVRRLSWQVYTKQENDQRHGTV